MGEPELLLVGRGSNTYFMQKYDNTFIKCIVLSGFKMYYVVNLDLFVIFCLSMFKCTYDKNNGHCVHNFKVGKPTKSARDHIIIAPTVSV